MTETEIGVADCPADAPEMIEAAVAAALKHEGREGTVAVLITDNENIHVMNRDFRNVDAATDVLSFPSSEGEGVPADGDFLGDIAISLERAREQAAEYGHSLKRELSFLAVHGTLHLLGYDHMEEAEREKMFALQEKILEEMNITR